MLYDGEVVKTIYIDSEADKDSIWRDFKFVDTKSLKSYKFPTLNSILCAPVGNSYAIGDTILLTQFIQECKGEWLLDFLNETSSVLSGFVNYWDIEILRRLTGDDDIKASYEDEETLSRFAVENKKNDVAENDVIVGNEDAVFMSVGNDIRWFCLSALSCIEDSIEKRSYKILYDTLSGISRQELALKFCLTQERIRQIIVKTTKQAKELLIAQRSDLKETKETNAKLRTQLKLLKEENVGLKTMLPSDTVSNSDEELSNELSTFLETPINDILLPARSINTLRIMGIKQFSDIPQIANYTQILKVRHSGKKTVHDIQHMLEDFHLTFGMSFSEVIDVLKQNYWLTAKKKWTKENNSSVSITELNRKDDIKQNAFLNLKKTKENGKCSENNRLDVATIKLTRSIIESARTPNGGFTKSQLSAIGIGWPPPIDWIEEKVGSMITPKQLEAFKLIKYVNISKPISILEPEEKNYKDIAFDMDERKKMEAILKVMNRFVSPVTARVVACSLDQSAWGDDVIHEDTIDSYLKRLPEVEYIKWGKYILKSKMANHLNKK